MGGGCSASGAVVIEPGVALAMAKVAAVLVVAEAVAVGEREW